MSLAEPEFAESDEARRLETFGERSTLQELGRAP